MAELLIFLYIAYLIGLGEAWYRLYAKRASWRWAELGWSFGLGSVLWGYFQFLLNVLDMPVGGSWIYFWQTVLVAMPLILSKLSFPAVSGGEPMGPLPIPAGDDGNRTLLWTKLVACFLIAIAVLSAALQALAFPMHMWDSIVLYGFKAKILFVEHTFKTDAFLDPSVLHNSADYPLLLAYLEAGFYRWLGMPDDRIVRLLFLAFWGSWLLILYEALADRVRRTWAWLLTALVATLPLFSNIFMGQAVSGFADIPFAFYWTAFCLLGLRLNRESETALWIRLVIFAIGCIFLKNEGTAAVILSTGLLVSQAGPGKRRAWLIAALVALIIISPWIWARHQLPHNAAHYFRLLSLPGGTVFDRLWRIVAAAALEMVRIQDWGLFWPLILCGILYPARRLAFPPESKLLVSAVVLQAIAYLYVYMTYRGNLELLIPITLLRLMIHGVGLLIVAVGWRLKFVGDGGDDADA